jgi:hypothetical protein
VLEALLTEMLLGVVPAKAENGRNNRLITIDSRDTPFAASGRGAVRPDFGSMPKCFI